MTPELAVQAIERLAEGVVVHDDEGAIIAFNPSALAVLGLSEEQLLGRTPTHPGWRAIGTDLADLPGSEHPAARVLRTGVAVQGDVLGLQLPGIGLRWLEVSASPVALGDVTGVVASFTDVTERRQAQDDLRSTLAELQRHLLPAALPAVEGADVAVSYQAAGPTLIVGGDFYDLFPATPPRWAFFVGDVCGHTVRAAAATSLARHTLRAAGQHLARAEQVLAWLNDAMLAQPDVPFCTAAFGYLAPSPAGGLDVSFALGGHPRPLLFAQDRAPEPVGEHGSLLGQRAVRQPRHRTVEVHLAPGDQLAFYTDGLLETNRPSLSEEELAVVARPGATAAETAGELLRLAAPADDATPHDDTAVLVLRANRV